jgi:hypothetical protein
MIVAQPIGHSVPFSKVVQISLDLFVLGLLMLPTGNQMTKIMIMTTFATVPIYIAYQLIAHLERSDRTYLVDPPDEFGRLHRDKTLNN